jgi:hypothetical protein
VRAALIVPLHITLHITLNFAEGWNAYGAISRARRPKPTCSRLSELTRRQPQRADAVARRLDERACAVVLLDAPTFGRPIGAAVECALTAHDIVDHVSEWGVFLIPRTGD